MSNFVRDEGKEIAYKEIKDEDDLFFTWSG